MNRAKYWFGVIKRQASRRGVFQSDNVLDRSWRRPSQPNCVKRAPQQIECCAYAVDEMGTSVGEGIRAALFTT